jgi:hypothetical protein
VNLADQAVRRFAGNPDVTVVCGSSRDRLKDLLPAPGVGCFFWLDAHGVYDYEGEDTEENPLLTKLSTIFDLRGGEPNVIAVDDARGMGTQPDWPPLAEILEILDENDFSAAIVDDTLIAASKSLEPDFYQLYSASRTVEVGHYFSVGPM